MEPIEAAAAGPGSGGEANHRAPYLKRVRRGRPPLDGGLAGDLGPTIKKRPILRRYQRYKKRTPESYANSKRILLSDQELLAAFRGTENHSEIAARAGVSRERIRQIYNAHFKNQYFSGETPRGHNRTNWLERNQERIEESWQPQMKKVAAQARAHDLEVMPVFRNAPGHKTCTTTLHINGHRCRVLYASQPTSTGSQCYRRYYHFSITKLTDDFVILVTPLRIFVVPTEVVAQCGRTVYLPMDKLIPYNNMHSRVDWWAYEEAWGLLQ